MAHIANRDEYKSELRHMLARNGVDRALTREYDEIANMCHMLKRPLANCAGLIMRLELAAKGIHNVELRPGM